VEVVAPVLVDIERVLLAVAVVFLVGMVDLVEAVLAETQVVTLLVT
jgi:hypothetical protein